MGFTVVRRGEAVADEPEKNTGKDWSGEECRLVVADYFEMLEHGCSARTTARPNIA
jgi:hypothetical protein